MPGSDLRRWRRACGKQGGQVSTSHVFLCANVRKELSKASLCLQSRREEESARAVMIVAELRVCAALLKEDRHHMEGILGEGLLPSAPRANRFCRRNCLTWCRRCSSTTFRPVLISPLTGRVSPTPRPRGRRAGCPLVAPSARATGQPLRSSPTSIMPWHAVTTDDLCWHHAEGIDACVGVTAPHAAAACHSEFNRGSTRSWPSVGTGMSWCAMPRRLVYPPLVPEILTSCFDVLILPPRPFRTRGKARRTLPVPFGQAARAQCRRRFGGDRQGVGGGICGAGPPGWQCH